MFEQLVVGGKVELFKKSRRIKENEETKEMLVSQIMDINDETIICTMPSRQGKMIVLEVGTLIEAFFYTGNYIYKSDCTVKSRGKEGNIFTVELRPETALVKFQRREFYRLKWMSVLMNSKLMSLYLLILQEDHISQKNRWKSWISSLRRLSKERMNLILRYI